MRREELLYITKYATFNRDKVAKYPALLQYFRQSQSRKKKEEVKKMLDQPNWQIYNYVDEDEEINRQQFLGSMVTNECTSINFKYFWGADIQQILHIRFSQLKELTFSVDSDCGYLTSIQFLVNLNAPNLVSLDLSNMEYGGYSLSPLKKCYFPRLETLKLQTLADTFRNYDQISQAYFPVCREISLFYSIDGCQERLNNRWRAKMQSSTIRKQYEELLFPARIGDSLKKKRKIQ